MTDRLAALALLVRGQPTQADDAVRDYRQRYADNALALDKWFAVQAQMPGESGAGAGAAAGAGSGVHAEEPEPGAVTAGAFVRGNPSGFHRADGAGYRLLAERLIALDALNPQVAARLATAFNGWQRLEPSGARRRALAIAELAAHDGLSRNLAEIIGNVLNH